MKKLLLFFLLIGFSAIAQNSKIKNNVDNLKTKIYLSKNGERLKWLDSLCKLVVNKKEFNFDSIAEATINYALKLDSLNIAAKNTSKLIFYKNNILYKHKEGLKIFKNFFQKINNITDNNILGEFYLNGADSYFFTGDKNTALNYYNSAENFALKAGNKKLAGTANLYMGFAFKQMVNIPDSSKKLQIAKNYFNETKDTASIIAATYGLALLYSQNGFYEEAKKERDEGIALAKSSNDHTNLAILYFNSAQDLRKTGHINECIDDLLLAIEFENKTGGNDYVYSEIICEILLAYLENNNIDAAEKYLKEINNNIDRFKNEANKENYLEVLKNMALAHGNFKDALKIGKEHLNLEKQKMKFEKIIDAENFLSKVYYSIGDKQNAYYHENKYYALKDSLFSEHKLKYFSFYQTLYETQKKDFQIKSQKKDLELFEKKSKTKNMFIFSLTGSLVSFFIFFILIRSRNAARKNEILIQSFSQHLITAQEQERTRIARELHDSVGQNLLVLKNMFLLKSNNNNEEVRMIGDTIKEVRDLSHNLHPFQFEKLGLKVSLENLIDEFQKNSPIFYSCTIDDISNNLSKDKELFVFRMIQECISNVEKHSEATACNLSVIVTKKQLVFQLKDNGKGFIVENKMEDQASLGLKTLKERSQYIYAYFNIKSELNIGTVITIKISNI